MKHHLIRSFLCAVLALALVLTASFALAGSMGAGGGSKKDTYDDTSGGGTGDDIAPQVTEAPKDDRFEVTAEYKWTEGTSYYYGMAVLNKSGATGSFLVSVDFLDGNGEKISGSIMSADPCEDGAEAFMETYIDKPFERVRYEITYADPLYNEITSYVQVTTEIAGDTAVIKAANTGNVDADAVQFYCLFLNDAGEVVKYDWGFLVDTDLQLKSGKVETRTAKCDVPFSSVKVYTTGRTDPEVYNTGTVEISEPSAEGYEVIREYYYHMDEYGFYQYAVAVKNTSGADAGLRAVITLYDANGGVIGVSTPEVDVVADGYAASLSVILNGPIDHAEYTVELTGPRYKSVNADIQVDLVQDKYTVDVSGTNIGEKTADHVEYEAWFLDENGNVISRDWNYLNGEGSVSGSIRPGETATKTAYSYYPYASVDVYVMGYRK